MDDDVCRLLIYIIILLTYVPINTQQYTHRHLQDMTSLWVWLILHLRTDTMYLKAVCRQTDEYLDSHPMEETPQDNSLSTVNRSLENGRNVWLIRPDISTNLDPVRWVTSQGRGWPPCLTRSMKLRSNSPILWLTVENELLSVTWSWQKEKIEKPFGTGVAPTQHGCLSPMVPEVVDSWSCRADRLQNVTVKQNNTKTVSVRHLAETTVIRLHRPEQTPGFLQASCSACRTSDNCFQ